MKRTLISLLLVLVLCFSLCTGLAAGAQAAPAATASPAAPAAAATTEAPAAAAAVPASGPMGEVGYNSGGFNVPGLTFQPQRPDTEGERFEPTEVFENVYFIGDSWCCCMLYVTDEGNIIMWDALTTADDYENIFKADMAKLGLDPADVKIVIASHGHGDHIGFAGLLERDYGTQLYIHEDDVELMNNSAEKRAEQGVPNAENYKTTKDGDVITLDNVSFELMHTPGHTAGSQSFFTEVTAFDGSKHLLTCWGGTSAPRDEEGVKTYLNSVKEYRAAIKEKGADAFLSMHPFVDYSTANVAAIRETGSSDPLIRTAQEMDFFCWCLEVYVQTKGKLAANGVTEFRTEGYHETALNIPYTIYMPDGSNGALYLKDTIAAEVFEDVYFIGTGSIGCMIFDTGDGLVMVDAMNRASDFTDIVAPAMKDFDLDPADLKVCMVTHGHGDHYGFAAYLNETYGTQVYMNKLDIPTAQSGYDRSVAMGREPTPVPEVNVDLVENSYEFGKFTFDWYYTPGHTIGCMSLIVNVTDFAGEDHLLCCWGGTGLNQDYDLMSMYRDSVQSFKATCVEREVDVEFSMHPFVDYSAENIALVKASNSSDALIRGVDGVEFFFTCIELTNKQRLDTLEAAFTFKDVKEDDWFFDTVTAAAKAKLTDGKGAGLYGFNDELTVAEAITFAVRAYEYNNGGVKTAKAAEGDWYATYVAAAIEYGIITEAPANPNAVVTRGDAAVIFAGALGKTDRVNDVVRAKYFTDIDGDAAYAAIVALADTGIVNGKEAGVFGVKDTFKRSEVATIVARLTGLCDVAVIAEAPVFNAYNSGGFNVPGLTFQPQRPDTQGERFEPTEVFENVYFIGDSWCCCMLYVTDEGNIIMWDALTTGDDYVNILKADMAKLGLDPADIKIVICSHGHGDHVGVSGLLEKDYGTQVYIHEDDVQTMKDGAERQAAQGAPIPEKYITVKDGDTITLDNVSFDLMHTPGHTPGSQSFFTNVTAFDGSEHILTCWGGTSAPRDEEGVKTYLASVQKYRAEINERGADAFLSMHPFVDYSTANVAAIRETGSSDPLIRTAEEMDFFCWCLEVYVQTKGKLAANGVTEFRVDGFHETALNIPYTIYMPDGSNGALYLKDTIAAKVFEDVYFIGTGNIGTMVYDTGDGIVLVDAMNRASDFTDIVAPAMKELGLDPADIKVCMITHGHGDHYGFAAYLNETYGTQIYMNTLDIETAQSGYERSIAMGREPTPVPEIDVDLTAGTYTFGKFSFNWYWTPGHTIGCMSYIANVTDFAGEEHLLCCWGGTGLNKDLDLMLQYKTSVDYFKDVCVERGVDVEFSMHPFVDYSAENIALVKESGSSDALVRGVDGVDFFFTCISLTCQQRIDSLVADGATPSVAEFNAYNSGGFNVPGLTFQPQRPDTEGVRFEPTEVFENVYFIGDSWCCCMLYVTDEGNIIMWDALTTGDDYKNIFLADMAKLGLDPADVKIVIASHGHGDHVGFSGILEKNFGTQVYIHEDDVETMKAGAERQAAQGAPIPENYITVKDGDSITLDNVTFDLMHTPGHTPGSQSFFTNVTAFDGSEHILTCWGGTSAPRDEEGVKTYLASVQKYRAEINERGADAFLSMHPFVDYSTANVAAIRETGSSDPLIRTAEEMDFFCWCLEVYVQTKGKLAANGVTEFRVDGFHETALNIPYTIYMPDGVNGALYLKDTIAAEVFEDVYFIGTGDIGTMVYDTGDGLVLVDAMWRASDFTDIVAPALKDFGLDPADIKVCMVTHGHGDHYGFAKYLQDTYGTKVYMNKLDIETAEAGYKRSIDSGREATPVPTVDVDLVEGSYEFGKFTFDWYYTPGHTIGCMSYIANVTDFAGAEHLLCCWGGTGLNRNLDLMNKYKASVDSFKAICVEREVDVEFSMHPFVDYSAENIALVKASNSSDALVRGVDGVDFFFTCIGLTCQQRLDTLNAAAK